MEVLFGYGFLVLFAILIHVVIVRWIFRINTQVDLLEAIRDELRKVNAKTGDPKE